MSNKYNVPLINFDEVIQQAQDMYNGLKDSEDLFSRIVIDGVETRGQLKDNERITNVKEENTKYCTCMFDAYPQRGSYIKIYPNSKDINGKVLDGVVYSIPIRGIVDYYFTILLFNTVVHRRRLKTVYNDDGDIVEKRASTIEDIPAFVQRVGMRERSVDAGIDRNSINRLITTSKWDIKKDDILDIGKDHYIVTDLEELDKDLLTCYMTYYRV